MLLWPAAAPAEANGGDGGDAAPKSSKPWYVRAGGAKGGKGSRRDPFSSLARAQRAAARGDTIVVLPSRRTLDGGIALEPGQKLVGAGPSVRSPEAGPRAPRIANPTGRRHSGDAVVLANRVTVRNLEIVGSHRGGIYGTNVKGVRILGNDVSGHNTSCTPGFHIPPFVVPTNVPGVGIPISDGLHNGWAGIMVDAMRGQGSVTIRRNHVHDAECGDGIDVRMAGRAEYRAQISGNLVEDLRQGEDFESVLAIGLQTLDGSKLVARLDRNRQTNLGNEGDPEILLGPLGSDTEGVFVNPADASRMRVTINRNTYTNPNGLGGFSGNGMEYVTMGDGSRSRVVIRNSSFTESSGDVLEQLALGTNHRMSMKLVNVVATRSLGFANSGFGNTVLIPGNNADCLLVGNAGAGSSLKTRVKRSELTDCANNGVTTGAAVANGEGPARRLELGIEDSKITGNRGANLRAGNFTELDRLSVSVKNTNLSDSRGTGSGFANVAFEEMGETKHSTIDLGGGALGSPGGNCIAGGMVAADVVRYQVTAEHNWWGELGPVPGRTVTVGGSLDADPFLTSPPESC